MTDFLDEKRREIKTRLDELRPLVSEYSRLEAAERALNGLNGTEPAPSRSRRSSRRSPARASGRPRGSGARAIQALTLVAARPGLTINELAEAMGIKENYLYRVMPSLAEEGKVSRRGKGWHATAKGKAEVEARPSEPAEESQTAAA